MAVTIENPILNGAYDVPARHFRFDEDGITSEVVESRCRSAYFLPISRPTKKSAQKTFDTEWPLDRIKETTEVNRIPEGVDAWRAGSYVSMTGTTRVLEYWNSTDRERRLFFGQRETVETAIYIAEVAARYGNAWIAKPKDLK